MTASARVSPILRDLTERVFLRLMPPRVRTFREFAESELILPGGPRAGLPFSCDFAPYSSELLEEYGRGRFSEFYLSGPAQAGKTLLGYILPAMYHLLELEEDVILGAPVVEMAQSAYLERLLPAIEKSKYHDLLPLKGGGSKGGKSLSIRLGNGAGIRFMGAGGGDQQRSSYTARVVIATELDKMDEAGVVSREADPVSQLKARSAAFGDRARFYGECTMSVKSGRIFREVVERGTDSRVYLPCPHCGEWVLPERKGLVGWQQAKDEIEAMERCGYQCSSCQKVWGESDRQKALRSPRVVARGQSVTRDGVVEGEMPRTLTYGFRWNCMASPLIRMADVARDEWRAEQSGLQADQKALTQFRWAEAWEEEIADLSRPDVNTILGKIVKHQKGAVPPETFKVTLGIDVGSYKIWWTLVAWTADARGHVVDFGAIDVPTKDGVKNPTAVLAALRAFRDATIQPGWNGRRPDRILIDSGYEQGVVYEFVKESGQPRYLACKGFGTSSRHGGWRDLSAAEPSPTRTVGAGYYSVLQPAGVHLVHVHADHWKSAVHDGFWAAQGAAGALTIYQGERTNPELREYARQIVAEQRTIKSVAEKEPKVVWVEKSRRNHYLDTTAYARCAAELEGVRVARAIAKTSGQRKPPAQGGDLKWSRDKY